MSLTHVYGRPLSCSRRHAAGQSRTAIRFFLLASLAFRAAAAIAGGLAHLPGRPAAQAGFAVPPSFFVSSLLLIVGSVAMTNAVVEVRRERQREFRHWLLVPRWLPVRASWECKDTGCGGCCRFSGRPATPRWERPRSS
ncbi:MAG: hypothetical protein U0992_11840 [Planctomycetaceae bacterium]